MSQQVEKKQLPKTMRWPDFSMYGMRLLSMQIPNGEMRLLMMGGDKYPQRLRALGFNNHGGLWLRRETRITLSEIQQHFNKVMVRELEPVDVYRIMRPKVGTPVSEDQAPDPVHEESVKTNLSMMKALPLGVNHLGQPVFQGADNRYIKTDDGQIINMENASAQFLLAITPNDLDLCADALVNRIVDGELFKTESLMQFAARIYDVDESSLEPYIEPFSDALNRALLRRMTKDTPDCGRNSFNLAIRLHEGLPPLTGALADSLVPMPMGVVMQRLAALPEGERTLYTPSLGNGALMTALADGSSVITHGKVGDVDLSMRQGIKIENTESIPEHNVWLANLVATQLDKPHSSLGHTVDRGDHFDVMQSLLKRDAKGRSVFMLKAGENSGEPDIDTIRLLTWISARFTVEGVVEVDGSLYGAGGSTGNRYMIAVGDRGQSRNVNFDKVDVVYDYEALWNWADAFVDERQRLAEESRVLVENSFQSPYIPASKIGIPTSMVPRNLVGPIREALSKMEKQFGPVDEFVSNELEYSEQELSAYFTPEQIDAIGLNIAAHKNGRGFINADQTGLGKGRCLAAMARYAAMNKMPVIFMTESNALLSDFWRDIVNTGNEDILKPFIFNPNVPIMLDGRRVINSSKVADVRETMETGRMPDGASLMMATYGHFNRDNRKALDPKSEYLKSVSNGAYLILDEAHNAAGESNINFNMLRAMKNSVGVTYSSATFAKDSGNFRIYSSVMPPSVSPHSIPSVLKRGGDPLAEVFSAMLAEDAVLVRREHDLSNIRFEVEVDREHLERNEELSNKFAEILEGIGLVIGDIDTLVNERNNLINQRFAREAKRINDAIEAANQVSRQKQRLVKPKVAGRREVGWFTTNFGSAFYNVLRQFMLSVKTDMAADYAIKALHEGRKPIVVVEQTNETMLKAAIERNKEIKKELVFDPYADEFVEEGLENAPDLDIEEETLLRPVTYRDVLHGLLDRVTVVNKFSKGKISKVEQVENDEIVRFIAALRVKIDAFPDLQVSPIDVMRGRIEEAGFTCSELSGRKIGIALREDGSQVVRPVRTGNRNKLIHSFNSGMLDALVLTTAGASGLSMHADRNFADQRQREMIEAQIANNVATRVQLLGRVNRLGQVCYPIYRSLSSGLPAENRLLSMQNAKLREMSANTTSNRSNNLLDEDGVDLLNVVGDEICYKYMIANPAIAKRLLVDETKLNDDARTKVGDKTWYANQMTGRIGMLPVSEQREIYQGLSESYVEHIRLLDEEGVNPLKSTELDIHATRGEGHIVKDPVIKTGSVFDQPVYAAVVEYVVTHKDVTWNRIESYFSESKANHFDGREPAIVMQECAEEVRRVFEEKKAIGLPKKYANVEEAEADPDSYLHRKKEKVELIEKIAPLLVPGNVVNYDSAFHGNVDAVIIDVKPPFPGDEELLGAYKFEMYSPEIGYRKYSLFSIDTMENFSIHTDTARIKEEVTNSKGYDETKRRIILDGNLFAAAEWATMANSGVSAVYTDKEGERLRAVVMPKDTFLTDVQMTGGFAINAEIAKIMMSRRIHCTNPGPKNENTRLELKTTAFNGGGNKSIFWLHTSEGKVRFQVTKSRESIQFIDRSMIPEVGAAQFKLIKGSREGTKTIEIDPWNLDALIDEVYDNNMSFFAEESAREEVLEIYQNLMGQQLAVKAGPKLS